MCNSFYRSRLVMGSLLLLLPMATTGCSRSQGKPIMMKPSSSHSDDTIMNGLFYENGGGSQIINHIERGTHMGRDPLRPYNCGVVAHNDRASIFDGVSMGTITSTDFNGINYGSHLYQTSLPVSGNYEVKKLLNNDNTYSNRDQIAMYMDHDLIKLENAQKYFETLIDRVKKELPIYCKLRRSLEEKISSVDDREKKGDHRSALAQTLREYIEILHKFTDYQKKLAEIQTQKLLLVNDVQKQEEGKKLYQRRQEYNEVLEELNNMKNKLEEVERSLQGYIPHKRIAAEKQYEKDYAEEQYKKNIAEEQYKKDIAAIAAFQDKKDAAEREYQTCAVALRSKKRAAAKWQKKYAEEESYKKDIAELQAKNDAARSAYRRCFAALRSKKSSVAKRQQKYAEENYELIYEANG